MALDESRDGDEIFNQNGLTFMIETPRGSGYSIESNLKKADGCGSCGGSCD
jgi:hypothetical protein